ncbi:MAG: ACP S-malonyltransferase [Cyanobacteria bacterium P01_D01_bin.123]
MTTAWVFPGQGSQAAGMGADLIELPGAGARLEQAESILGWSVLQLTEAELELTQYTQPALFVVEALLTDQLLSQRQPDCLAGHSLGEYSALYCAGVFDFETGLQLVRKRSQLMAEVTGGAMAAVMGFDREKLEKLCAETDGAEIANDNSLDQVVVTGLADSVKAVTDALQARRTMPLAVSGAFHSSFMREAADRFATQLETVTFNPPKCPVYSNATATASSDPGVLKQNLFAQMVSPVRWRETLTGMAADGVTDMWEVGPGKVLTGLAKRTVKDVRRVTISDTAAVQSAIAQG